MVFPMRPVRSPIVFRRRLPVLGSIVAGGLSAIPGWGG